MNAANLDVETQEIPQPQSEATGAAVRSRWTGGSYVTNGTGSPAIYCTADISVSDATLTANVLQGRCGRGQEFLRCTDRL